MILKYFNDLFDGYSFLFEAKQLFLYLNQEVYRLNFYDWLIIEASLLLLITIFYLSLLSLRMFENHKFWVKKAVSLLIFFSIYSFAFIIKYFFKTNYLTYELKALAFYFIIYVTLRDGFFDPEKKDPLSFILKFDLYSLLNWIFIICVAHHFLPDSAILEAGLMKIFIFGIFILLISSITLSKKAVYKLINEKANPKLNRAFKIFYSANWLLIFLFLFMWLSPEPFVQKFQRSLLSLISLIMWHVIFFGGKALFLRKIKNNKNENQLLRLYNFINFLTKLMINPLIALSVCYIWKIDIISFMMQILGAKFAFRLLGLAFLIPLLGVMLILLDIFMHIYIQNRAGAFEFGKRFDMFINILNVLFKILIYIVFLFFVMLLFEVNPSILLSNFWVFTASLTFVFQNLMKDFAIGIIMMFEDTFYIGDEVEVAGVIGEVEEVTLRVLKIRNREGALVSIPFNKVEIFANKNRGYIFVLFPLVVANTSDIPLVTQLLQKAGEKLSLLPEYSNKILQDITILGPITLSKEGMEFEVRMKMLPTRIKPLKSIYYGICKDLFAEHNIEFGGRFIHFKDIFN